MHERNGVKQIENNRTTGANNRLSSHVTPNRVEDMKTALVCPLFTHRWWISSCQNPSMAEHLGFSLPALTYALLE